MKLHQSKCQSCGNDFVHKGLSRKYCGSRSSIGTCAYRIVNKKHPLSKHGKRIKSGLCVMCGQKILLRGGRQKYCGSAIDKTGCAYKNQLTSVQIWVKNHPELHAVYRKRAYQKNPDYHMNWYAKNGRTYSDAVREVTRRWQRENPEKVAASCKLRQAVKLGKVIKPKNCENCGRETKLDGHHDDYDFPLIVRWLCARCHKKHHVAVREREKVFALSVYSDILEMWNGTNIGRHRSA